MVSERIAAPKTGRRGFNPDQRIPCPKKRYPLKGFHKVPSKAYCFLLDQGGPRVSCYNACHTLVTYGIPSERTQKFRDSFQKTPDRYNGQGPQRNGTLRVS